MNSYTNETLTRFHTEFLLRGTSGWGKQPLKKDKDKVEYVEGKGTMPIAELEHHFSQAPRSGYRGAKIGSLGFKPAVNGRTRMVCIDVDNAEGMRVVSSLILPKLDELGLEYIFEESGNNGDRCHVWLNIQVPIDLAKRFIESLPINSFCASQ